MPKRFAVFGIETRAIDTYPDDKRAAALIGPIPFWWFAEVMAIPTEAEAVEGKRAYMTYVRAEEAMLELGESVRARYLMLPRVSPFGWQVFEQDEVLTLAREMIEVGQRGGFPGASRIAMAGRLAERVSTVPCRAAFYGQ